MRWFYCVGCGRPAVVFRDGTAGHSEPELVNDTECKMFSELESLEYAERNRDALICPTPPEFKDRENELG